MDRLGLGKLPTKLLAKLLARHARADASVLVGPGIGEDAAVIDMGERCLVAKTDPITFASDAIGWYAVHVNANDVACCGARPRWFLATLLLPEGATQPCCYRKAPRRRLWWKPYSSRWPAPAPNST